MPARDTLQDRLDHAPDIETRAKLLFGFLIIEMLHRLVLALGYAVPPCHGRILAGLLAGEEDFGLPPHALATLRAIAVHLQQSLHIPSPRCPSPRRPGMQRPGMQRPSRHCPSRHCLSVAAPARLAAGRSRRAAAHLAAHLAARLAARLIAWPTPPPRKSAAPAPLVSRAHFVPVS